MRILVLSESGYGAWFAALFVKEGHEVDYVVKAKYKNILGSIAPLRSTKVPNQYELGRYDMTMFDMTGNGKIADHVNEFCPVIGDSLLADELEDNRQFGIEVMESVGIKVPPWHQFNDIKAATSFVKETQKRYVFKPSGDNQDTAATYVSKDAEDLLDYLNKLSSIAKGSEFILQEFIEGTEVSTEAFWNGSSWFFINNTFELKKFMNDDLGPNTGCSGNLVYSHCLNEPKIFQQGLKKLTSFLEGTTYRGMIDLNCIVTNNDVYGLEWTPRFGYDASATQTLLIKDGYANFLYQIITGQVCTSSIFSPGFAASVRLSIPPYPLITNAESVYQRDIPINGLSEDDLTNTYLYDVYLDRASDLVTAGHEGFIACPIVSGMNPDFCFDKVYERIKGIKIPNLQYRTDCKKEIMKRFHSLQNGGWFSYNV